MNQKNKTSREQKNVRLLCVSGIWVDSLNIQPDFEKKQEMLVEENWKKLLTIEECPDSMSTNEILLPNRYY
jgi:hypothetical protein